MKEDLEKAIKALTEKAVNTASGEEATQFAQAALSLAQTMGSLGLVQWGSPCEPVSN